MKIKHLFITAIGAVKNLFPKRVHPKSAIGISIILHVIAGAALASFFAQAFVIQQDSPSIEFDLVSEHKDLPFPESVANDVGFNENESEAGKQTKSKVANVLKRRAVVLASLANLSELSYTFGFVKQDATADSLSGSFLPVQGNAPTSEYNSGGLKNGESYGRGGILGGLTVCPAPRGR